MKKTVGFLLALTMLLPLCACGGKSGEAPDAQSGTSVQTPGEGSGSGEDAVSWPTSAVNLVVPASAGGGTDSNARVVAKYLTEELGVPVNVVNIGGASGVTGCTEVKNAAADGTTFLYFDDNMVCNYALGAADFSWDAFDPCGRIYEIPFYLVGTSSLATIDDLKAAAATPDTVMFAGESGAFIGILPHAINGILGISMKIVDGGQMAERLPLIISNQVQLTFAPMSQVRDYYETGDLNLLCTFGTERVSDFPEIPTAVESGLDVQYQRFQGVLAPKGTDAAIIGKMSDVLGAISQNTAFQEESAALNVYVHYGSADEFSAQFTEFSANVERYASYIG